MKKINQQKKNQKYNKISTVVLTFAFLCCSFLSPSGHAREMTPLPRVKLQTLDKATARTETFETRVGNTLKFGPLYIKVQSCQKSSPIDQPESAAFIQIWEVAHEDKTTKEKAEWVFSGWMFASSPALSGMDHPIYDVWLIDCLPEEGQEPEVVIPAPSLATTAQETPEDPNEVPLD